MELRRLQTANRGGQPKGGIVSMHRQRRRPRRLCVLALGAVAAAASVAPTGAQAATEVYDTCTVTTGIVGGSCSITVPGIACDLFERCAVNGRVDVSSVFCSSLGCLGSPGLVRGDVRVDGLEDIDPDPRSINARRASKSGGCGPALGSCSANTFDDLRDVAGDFAFVGSTDTTVTCSSQGSVGVLAVSLTCTALLTR